MSDSESLDAPAAVLSPDRSALPPDQAEARARVGRALRLLGHKLVGHHATVGATRCADRRSRPPGRGDRRQRRTGRASSSDRPATGARRPRAARRCSATTSDRSRGARRRGVSTSTWCATATKRSPSSRSTPPTRARPAGRHGGIVAALFDDVFGFVLTINRAARVHRRAHRPLRAWRSAARAVGVPGSPDRARRPQDVHDRGVDRRGSTPPTRSSTAGPGRSSSPSCPRRSAAAPERGPVRRPNIHVCVRISVDRRPEIATQTLSGDPNPA